MTVYQILCLLGVPSLIGALAGAIVTKFNSHRSLKRGVQALLRDRLFATYNDCNKKGFASIADRDNFTNMYEQYHNLGANGVMDDIYEKFMDLPTDKKGGKAS